MKNSTKFASVVFAVCLFLSSSILAQAPKKPKPEKNKFLENKTFDSEFTEVKEKGKPKPIKGDLIVKGSKVQCDIMEEKAGLSISPYHVVSDTTYKDGETDMHIVVFEATYTEGKSETKFEATLTNNQIKGTVIEFKGGAEKRKYEFVGTEKEKPGKKK
jgi:hypothetical protein